MSTELDNGTVRELSSKFENLSLVVMELKTDVKNLIAQSMPMLNQQASGITNLDNRMTRIEEQISHIKEQARESRVEFEGKIAAVTLAADGKIAAAAIAFEAKIAAMEKVRTDDKETTEKQQKKQVDSLRWVLGFCVSMMIAIIAVVSFFMHNLQVKP